MTLAMGWADVCGVFLMVLEDDVDDIFLQYHVLNVRLFDAPCETEALGKAFTFKGKIYYCKSKCDRDMQDYPLLL